MSPSPTRNALLREFWTFDPRGMLLAVGLNLLAALLEGLGFLLLLPLLGAAGFIEVPPGALAALPIPSDVFESVARLKPELRLAAVLGIFVALVALQSGIQYARDIHGHGLRLRFVDDLRERFFGALAHARWNFLSRHHSSEYLSVLTTDIQRVGQAAYFLLHLFTQITLLAVYIGVACRLSLPVTLLALATGIVLWGMLRRTLTAARHSGKALSGHHGQVFGVIQEFLTGLKLIKIHGEEQGFRNQFGVIVEDLRKQQLRFSAASSGVQAIYRIGGAIALALLVFGAVAQFELPTAVLLVLIGVFIRMLPQLGQLHHGIQQLSHSAPAFENWRRWMNLCADAREGVCSRAESSPAMTGITLRNVFYRHPAGSQLLSVPETKIPARSTTAIVGPSGAGKTTLLDLICGLNPPDTGEVRIDGQTIEPESVSSSRLNCRPVNRYRLAYVPQECVLFDGTIRENLTWGSDAPSESRLRETLDRATAGDFIARLPDGLNTRVGERGVRLSGGERQRLALARALLREPELLILDEATNSLDSPNQRLILNAVRELRGQMTILIVTHRLDEIRDMIDGVVHVDAGRVSAWLSLKGGAA